MTADTIICDSCHTRAVMQKNQPQVEGENDLRLKWATTQKHDRRFAMKLFDLNLDLFRFSLLAFWQGDHQDSILELCKDLRGVDERWQRKAS